MPSDETPDNDDIECVACGTKSIDPALFYEVEEDSIYVCRSCHSLLPPSLLKACWDEFDYALGLRSGQEFRFRKAAVHGCFVTLSDCFVMPYGDNAEHEFPRGVDIRISEIVWCADAPDGS